MVMVKARARIACDQCGSSRGVWRPAARSYLCETCAEELEYVGWRDTSATAVAPVAGGAEESLRREMP